MVRSGCGLLALLFAASGCSQTVPPSTGAAGPAADTSRLVRQAEEAQAVGDLKRTAELLGEVAAQRPRDAVARFRYGVALTELLRWSEAVAELRAAVTLDPANDFGHYFLGQTLARLSAVAEAQQHLERAVALRPQDADYRQALGWILLQREATPETTAAAIRAFEEVLRLSPGRADAFHGLGVAYQRAGQTGNAVVSLRRAVDLAPESASARYALWQALVRAGKRQEAAATLARFRALQARDVARIRRGFFESETRRDPLNPNVHYHLGLFYRDRGEDAAARRAFMRAAELAPDDPRIRRELAALSGVERP